MPRPRGKPEHQERVWLFARDECWQVPIDRRVARLEHMSDAPHAREGRVAASREFGDQQPGRIRRRAGKRSEAGEEDGEGHALLLPPPLAEEGRGGGRPQAQSPL